MSPRGEQGTGVIIANETEEWEGGDYGKKECLKACIFTEPAAARLH